MKQVRISTFLFTVLFFLGCTGGSLNGDGPDPELQYITLDGRPTTGVSVEFTGEKILLGFSSLDKEGRFLRFTLPEGKSVVEETWHNDEKTLHLLIPADNGFEIGITALRGYSGNVVSTSLLIGTESRATSRPPQGVSNIVTDLLVTPVADDRVQLEWTETNVGDYDFNGEVNISDLVPLGRRLGEPVARNAPNAELLTSYWVDGDRNGEINIGDLTPIGTNHHSEIAGYLVRQNGKLLTGPDNAEITVLARNGWQRPNLPARYSIVFDGSVDDFWEVAPVDSDSLEGANNAGKWHTADLKAAIEIEGVGLLDFSDPDLISGLEYNSYRLSVLDLPELLRRLHPGIDPDGYELGDTFHLGIGEAAFTDLPRNQALFLEVRYLPEYNLETGTYWSETDLAEGHNIVSTYIPFKLPVAGKIELDARIQIIQQPDESALLGIETVTRTATETTFVDKQLDYKQGVIRQDTDLDASFADEAQLADQLRIGISTAQLAGLVDEENNQYNTRFQQTILGRLDHIDEGAGSLVLADASATDSGGTWPIGDVTVNFDEATSFGQQQLEASGPVFADIAPAQLEASDYMYLEVEYLLDSFGEIPDKHWASTVSRQVISVASDSLAVIPAKLDPRPGEAVLVTVYANKTAGPFYSLDGLGLSLDTGNYFRHGSFNIGAPGGAANRSDGLWLQTGATAFILPPDSLIIESPYSLGRALLEFSLTPVDGHEIQSASGALFCFELICHSDIALSVVRHHGTPRTYYSDYSGNPYYWSHDEDIEIPVIAVSGDPLEFTLTNPPGEGSGTPEDPFVAAGGETFTLMLVDPLYGNVTISPETVYTIDPTAAGSVDKASSTLIIAEDYTGALSVAAAHAGIHTNPELGLSLEIPVP